MKHTTAEVAARLTIDEFPRSARYDPLYAEAHSLPFANAFFDAIVSFDAYHYFGTDDLYLGYISQFVRPGGTIAMVVPGVVEEVTGGVPAHLAAQWQWDWCSSQEIGAVRHYS